MNQQQNEHGKPGALRRGRSAFLGLGSLRAQLFLGSALLSTAILLVTGWAIKQQLVTQAREQLQVEVGTLLPLYDAVLDERLRRLATMSATMAASPIVKTLLANEQATRDRSTLHEMFADLSQDFAQELDLKLLTDGDGLIVHAEGSGSDAPQLQQLEAARLVGEQQQPSQNFAQLNDKVFQLALAPVLLHAATPPPAIRWQCLGRGSSLTESLWQSLNGARTATCSFLSARSFTFPRSRPKPKRKRRNLPLCAI